MARPEEELSVQINYNVSGRTVNYVAAAILGLGGRMNGGANKRRTKASNKKVRAKRHNTNGFKGKTARA